MNKNSRSRNGSSPGSRRRPRRSGRPAEASPKHTSQPTSRTAYVETREWLLERHGATCAYCARRFDPNQMTLDHVTPRRGQTAYDRRDNLVLSCPGCNADKADRPILTFLLARRSRAASLLHFGDHLSPMLLNLARQIAEPEEVERVARVADPDYPYRD